MTLTEIKNETDAIYDTYASRFAGMPRATRELSELDALIRRLTAVIQSASAEMGGGRNPALLSIVETAEGNLQTYTDEKKAIQEAQSMPFTKEAAILAGRANREFDMYGRHFAGQDRATRDERLLEELIGELQVIRGLMASLIEKGGDTSKADLNTVENQIELYETEITNIRAARSTGTLEEQGSRFANLANAQFSLYTNHFAGKARTTRRPALLERMIGNLDEYHHGMQALVSGGYDESTNIKNMDIVRQNLEMYRTELIEVEKAQQDTSLGDVAGALGGEANEYMKEYRENYAGQDRTSRDLGRLSVICDNLRDVALQMMAISTKIELDYNDKNIEIVSETRALYEAEWKAIKEATNPA